jgi:hypothetical protein
VWLGGSCLLREFAVQTGVNESSWRAVVLEKPEAMWSRPGEFAAVVKHLGHEEDVGDGEPSAKDKRDKKGKGSGGKETTRITETCETDFVSAACREAIRAKRNLLSEQPVGKK